ncbi:hypothetical protein ElyMa_006283700 [Elysia marginata]|uniref:Uncharacterized protein n=1 Tax=Elysia marginata TaxID=1093978 RepID=A0AAV4HFR3_9GAST|nr:hypothetical protein ElyMa_006283700 [Elysia marginata]
MQIYNSAAPSEISSLVMSMQSCVKEIDAEGEGEETAGPDEGLETVADGVAAVKLNGHAEASAQKEPDGDEAAEGAEAENKKKKKRNKKKKGKFPLNFILKYRDALFPVLTGNPFLSRSSDFFRWPASSSKKLI